MKSKFLFFIPLFIICTLNLNAQNNEKLDSISLLSPKHDTIPHEIVEIPAKFQGGDIIKFNKFLSSQLSLPLEANIRKWSGKTYVRFIVDWDGKVKDVSVYKSSEHKVLDDEAIRVVKLSPVWTPAQSNGVLVPQIFIIPVKFKALGTTRYQVGFQSTDIVMPIEHQ